MKQKRLLCVLLAVLLLTVRVGYAEELEPPFPDEEPVTEESVTEEPADPEPDPEPAPEPEAPEESGEPEPAPPEEDGELEPETPEEGGEPEPTPPEENGEPEPVPPEDGGEPEAPEENGEELPPEEEPPEDLPEEAGEPEELPEVPAELPVIQVSVPDSGRIMVNPYGLEVAAEYGASRDQVVHAPQALTNLSEVPVTVNVYAAGSFAPWSDANLVTEPPRPDTPWKELFLYVEFQNAPGQWTGWFGGLPNQVAVAPQGGSKSNVLTLDPWSEGWFRISGAASGSPERTWTEEDAVNVTLAFTFEPVTQRQAY